MTKRTILIVLLLAGLLFLLTGCFPGAGDYPRENPVGFFWGLWHGFIAVVSLIVSIFNSQVNIYEVNNTGFWYNLGFLLGVGSPLFGGLIFRS